MPYDSENKECGGDARGVLEDIVRNMRADERVVLGFMCKKIIDLGKLMRVGECGSETDMLINVLSSMHFS